MLLLLLSLPFFFSKPSSLPFFFFGFIFILGIVSLSKTRRCFIFIVWLGEEGVEVVAMKASKDEAWMHALAGCAGGSASSILLHPLDVIKTRRQVHLVEKSVGLLSSLYLLARKEGRTGWYAGLGPSLIGSSIAWSTYLAMYQVTKGIWNEEASIRSDLLRAYVSGAFVSLLTNPIWMVKTRHQIGQARNESLWKTLKRTKQNEGMFSWWKGSFPGLLMATHGALQMSTYEALKRLRHDFVLDEDVSAWEASIMASASKILASTLTYPLQVIRTQMQKEGGLDVRDTVRFTWKKHGTSGFYAGWLPHVARVVPSAAITFAVYESTLSLLRKTFVEESSNERMHGS